jgi:hypothetical protein
LSGFVAAEPPLRAHVIARTDRSEERSPLIWIKIDLGRERLIVDKYCSILDNQLSLIILTFLGCLAWWE